LHHPLNHITVAILVTNAIVKITNHFCSEMSNHCTELHPTFPQVAIIMQVTNLYQLTLSAQGA